MKSHAVAMVWRGNTVGVWGGGGGASNMKVLGCVHFE